MNSASPKPNKVLLGLLVVFAIVNAIDFAFYGMSLHNLVACIGFLLSAWGSWSARKGWAILGAIMVIAAAAWKYLAG